MQNKNLKTIRFKRTVEETENRIILGFVSDSFNHGRLYLVVSKTIDWVVLDPFDSSVWDIGSIHLRILVLMSMFLVVSESFDYSCISMNEWSIDHIFMCYIEALLCATYNDDFLLSICKNNLEFLLRTVMVLIFDLDNGMN